jgi:hypothetical protein
MAGNLPVTAGLEVIVRWSTVPAAQVVALNVLHFQQAPVAPVDQARADAIDTLVKTAFTSSALGLSICDDYGIHSVSTRDMQSNTNLAFIGAGAVQPGLSTSDCLPPQISLVVTLSTGFRGRSYRGRVYVPFMTEAANSQDGSCNQTDADQAIAWLQAIRDNMSAQQQSTMAVLSRFTTPPGSPPGTPAIERNPPILTEVASIGVRDLRWDIQRRRAR